MHYLGVDWGVEQHGLCLMGSDGRVLSEMSIPHSSEGFETLKSLLTDFDKVAINIETNNGLLVDWLSSQEHSIYVTTPTVVARRRPRRSKDDRGDAFPAGQPAANQRPRLSAIGASELHCRASTADHQSL